MHDPYQLQRFIDAQAPVFEQVCAELRAGRKQTHWMWFIFPQIAGLGNSETARRFAIVSLPEAHAYLHHPLLGERLRKCTALVNAVQGKSAYAIFGDPDEMKFRSSMTLFSAASGEASPDRRLFNNALHKYFDDEPDGATLARLPEQPQFLTQFLSSAKR
ncbi:DUF1810 domain-containing protein [Oxalobacteraceae bacterium CAVE-383]|nr:DUF1810 domain-containing protein [Oxalobacteraceae bacterium CAVE-383]